MTDFKWWAAYCRPQRELLTAMQLAKVAEVYFPHAIYYQTGKRYTVRPTLGRYLFVRTQRQLLHRVTNCFGVSGLVGVAGDPRPISDDVMEELIESLGREPKIYTCAFRRKRFNGKVGQRFVFGEGSPLAGLIAQIVAVVDNERLVAKLEVDLLGAPGRTVRARTGDVGELLTA